MKTSISIPDETFEDSACQSENITQQLNDVYVQENAELDNELHKMQIASLPKEEW